MSWRLLTIARFSLMTWFGISITYIRFHRGFKLQGFDRAKLPYASGLQPYLAYYAAISTWVICFVSTLRCCINHRSSDPLRQFSGWQVFLKHGWDTATFVTNYIPFILFPILYVIWKFKTKVPIVRASEMDFTTGLDQIEADTCVVQN